MLLLRKWRFKFSVGPTTEDLADRIYVQAMNSSGTKEIRHYSIDSATEHTFTSQVDLSSLLGDKLHHVIITGDPSYESRLSTPGATSVIYFDSPLKRISVKTLVSNTENIQFRLRDSIGDAIKNFLVTPLLSGAWSYALSGLALAVPELKLLSCGFSSILQAISSTTFLGRLASSVKSFLYSLGILPAGGVDVDGPIVLA